MNQRLTLLLLLVLGSVLSGCATERKEALEHRQDRYDEHANARAERREIRSERADARYERW